MESERYKKFLEIESRKAPIKRKESEARERFWIYWEDGSDVSELRRRDGLEMIDSPYFGGGLQNTIVIDARVARIIQARFKELEEENMRFRKHVRLMKIMIAALVLIIFIMIIFIGVKPYFY